MRSVPWMLVATIALLAAGAVAAGAADKPPDGKALYKEYCKPCHAANSKHGEFTPMTLIQEQWDRFFKEKLIPSHGVVVDTNHGGKKLLEVLTPEMLEKIKKFVVEHAADSEHPMTCG